MGDQRKSDLHIRKGIITKKSKNNLSLVTTSSPQPSSSLLSWPSSPSSHPSTSRKSTHVVSIESNLPIINAARKNSTTHPKPNQHLQKPPRKHHVIAQHPSQKASLLSHPKSRSSIITQRPTRRFPQIAVSGDGEEEGESDRGLAAPVEGGYLLVEICGCEVGAALEGEDEGGEGEGGGGGGEDGWGGGLSGMLVGGMRLKGMDVGDL